jgi:hypothetical protein
LRRQTIIGETCILICCRLHVWIPAPRFHEDKLRGNDNCVVTAMRVVYRALVSEPSPLLQNRMISPKLLSFTKLLVSMKPSYVRLIHGLP